MKKPPTRYGVRSPYNGPTIDLHTHSTASDGALSPAALVREAAARGVQVLALTDHDTIRGVEEAGRQARACGITLIPGVEIDVDSRSVDGAPSGETHILGLGLTNPSPACVQELARLEQARRERGRRIIERMQERGWPADYDELLAFAGTGTIGRPHVAAYLVKLKKVRTIQGAFDQYLARGRDLYIPKESAPLARALAVIKESGALAVLAHPASLYVSWSKLPLILAGLKEAGLDGIEAWHPMSTRHVCERMEKLGRSLGLCISAGSDYHGENRQGRCLGRTAGGQKIPLSVLEAMPALHRYAANDIARCGNIIGTAAGGQLFA